MKTDAKKGDKDEEDDEDEDEDENENDEEDLEVFFNSYRFFIYFIYFSFRLTYHPRRLNWQRPKRNLLLKNRLQPKK